MKAEKLEKEFGQDNACPSETRHQRREGVRRSRRVVAGVALLLGTIAPHGMGAEIRLPHIEETKPRNIVFILADDHRADAMGFLGHPVLKTPQLDRLASEGVYCANALVTTSLCSPSRASILTGLYAHNHKVIDNNNPVDPSLVFFPQYLQAAGYETAFIGKWHMGGNEDNPQRGFDHWVSFKGQGTYWADGRGVTRRVAQTTNDGFNVDGRRVPQKGYVTDELTDLALKWLNGRKGDRPFFLYLSHKAVHSDFVPADRHLGRYRDAVIPLPESAAPPTPTQDKPRWVRDQRNSRHGIEYGYNVPDYTVEKYARRYFETLLAVDDSVGRILDWLDRKGLGESTLVVYMGDNGFHFGEHGLIDKRTAYEDSIKVPLLLRCPEVFRASTRIEDIVANIDIAPTLLEFAGLVPPHVMDGRSFYRLARGERIPWREYFLYEYFWEWNGPYTPTLFAIRGQRYKYIHPHGVWDLDELYDLEVDPGEKQNLINSPEYRAIASDLNRRLFDMLEASGGREMPVRRNLGEQFPRRRGDRSGVAPFPDAWMDEIR